MEFNAPRFDGKPPAVPTFRCGVCALWFYIDDLGRARPDGVPECCKCWTPSLRGKPLSVTMWGPHGKTATDSLVGGTEYDAAEDSMGLVSVTGIIYTSAPTGIVVTGVRNE